ncbi:MAG: PilZ domain-containing protein [Muribaculaceae bacterium]|nr:PilZ domain-containing protein [Muribaculaceae bacterium]
MKDMIRNILVGTVLLTVVCGNFIFYPANAANETSTEESSSRIESIQDRRKYDRYANNELVKPVTITSSDNRAGGVIDISRGGIAIKHNNTLNEGDIIPINIVYGGINIPTEVQIVSRTDTRAGAKYTTTDFEFTKEILYLTVVLESDNHLLKTKLSS